ncbi:MAG: helix-turn-helix domain-containing protein [Pseudonocardiaceae bacterium]
MLNDNDWTQREIATAMGMQRSSVFEIIKGRRVIGHHLLGRIADGLGIPREWLDLGPGDGNAYAGGVEDRLGGGHQLQVFDHAVEEGRAA